MRAQHALLQVAHEAVRKLGPGGHIEHHLTKPAQVGRHASKPAAERRPARKPHRHDVSEQFVRAAQFLPGPRIVVSIGREFQPVEILFGLQRRIVLPRACRFTGQDALYFHAPGMLGFLVENSTNSAEGVEDGIISDLVLDKIAPELSLEPAQVGVLANEFPFGEQLRPCADRPAPDGGAVRPAQRVDVAPALAPHLIFPARGTLNHVPRQLAHRLPLPPILTAHPFLLAAA